MIVGRSAYCAIMHKWFYLRIGSDSDSDDDHIDMHPKNTILPTDRLLSIKPSIKHASGNYFLGFSYCCIRTPKIRNLNPNCVKLSWMVPKCAKCNFIRKLYA